MPLCCISFVPLLLIKMLSDTFLYSLDFAYDARCDEISGVPSFSVGRAICRYDGLPERYLDEI